MSTTRAYIGGMSLAGSFLALGLAALVVVGLTVALHGSPLFSFGDRGDGALNLGRPAAGIDAGARFQAPEVKARPDASSVDLDRGSGSKPAPAARAPLSQTPVAPTPTTSRPVSTPVAPSLPQVESGPNNKQLGTGLADVVDGTGKAFGGTTDRIAPGLGRPVQDVTGLLSDTVRGVAGPETPVGGLLIGLGFGGSPPAGTPDKLP